MSIFGPGRLVVPNAVVDVEAVAITQVEGGTVQTFTAVASNVPVLMTLFSGGRGREFSDAQTDRVTVSGVDASLRRADVRLKVVTAPDTMSQFDGLYLRVESAVAHPAGLGGLLKARTTLQCSRFGLPKV